VHHILGIHFVSANESYRSTFGQTYPLGAYPIAQMPGLWLGMHHDHGGCINVASLGVLSCLNARLSGGLALQWAFVLCVHLVAKVDTILEMFGTSCGFLLLCLSC
jgi:hypothetical protein